MSTLDILYNVYTRIAVGGVVVIDDWGVPEAKKAAEDFRRWHGVTAPMRHEVFNRASTFAHWWRVTQPPPVLLWQHYKDARNVHAAATTAGGGAAATPATGAAVASQTATTANDRYIAELAAAGQATTTAQQGRR